MSRPFRDRIEITSHGCSLPLQRRIADFGAERSGRSAVDALKEHYGIELPLYTVDTITQRIAGEANTFNMERPDGEKPAATQVSGVDGSMIPIVEFKEVGEVSSAAEKADKRKRRVCQWNEIRVCTVHDIDRADSRYGVSFGSVLEAGLMMRMTSEQCGMDENTHIHGVGDGATWIAEAYHKQFGIQGRFLIDLYHVCEYLAAAAEGCVKDSTNAAARKKWVDRQKHWLKQSKHTQVLRNLERHLESPGVGEEKAPVRRCWRYLNNRQQQLDYRAAIEAGLPIGSGETESAHRHLIQRRLKMAGAWWRPRTAANMAQLRTTRANLEWNQFWNEKAA